MDLRPGDWRADNRGVTRSLLRNRHPLRPLNPHARALSGQCARSDHEPAIDEHVLDAGGITVRIGVGRLVLNGVFIEIADSKVIRWKSKDGLEIEGMLAVPGGYDGKKRIPLLVLIHGGPPQ